MSDSDKVHQSTTFLVVCRVRQVKLCDAEFEDYFTMVLSWPESEVGSSLKVKLQARPLLPQFKKTALSTGLKS